MLGIHYTMRIVPRGLGGELVFHYYTFDFFSCGLGLEECENIFSFHLREYSKDGTRILSRPTNLAQG